MERKTPPPIVPAKRFVPLRQRARTELTVMPESTAVQAEIAFEMLEMIKSSLPKLAIVTIASFTIPALIVPMFKF